MRPWYAASPTAARRGGAPRPSGTAPAPPAGATVVASGLVEPRFVAVADDGTLYVSEAGNGGSEVLPRPPELSPDEPPPTRGPSGRVVKIGTDGTQSVLVDGLPSYSTFAGSDGPSGLVLGGGALWLAVGGPGAVTAVVTPLSVEGQAIRIDPATGTYAAIGDVLAYEHAKNPDAEAIQSNLYGLAWAADGALYVGDAAGNALYRVEPYSSQVSLVTAFPGIPVPPDELPPGAPPGTTTINAVPTGVAVGPDGRVCVALYSGFPFPPGRSKVVQVAPDGALTDVAPGQTTIVGTAFGPDGQLYISEISAGVSFADRSAPPVVQPGSIRRVAPDGTAQVVVADLNLPNGIAFDGAGNLYVVVNCTTGFGNLPATPPQGQVLRIDGVAPARPRGAA